MRHILLFLLITVGVAHAGDTLTVNGLVPTPASFTVADLKSKCGAELKSIEFTTRGTKHKADAIPLISVLKAAGFDTELASSSDPKTKHPQLRQVVIVKASDGYTVAFSVAELLTSVGNAQARVAVSQDGADLTTDGAMKLIVTSDSGPARSVRNLESLTIVDPTAATTQPSR